MSKELGQDNYPFDGGNFGIDEELQNVKSITIEEHKDIIKVAREHNSEHGAFVQMIIESLSHLWDKPEHSDLLVQLALAWYEGDCVYRKNKPYSTHGMLEVQLQMIIEYYSPPELLDERLQAIKRHQNAHSQL